MVVLANLLVCSPNIPDPGHKFAVWGRRKCKQAAAADVARKEITVIRFFVFTVLGCRIIMSYIWS